MSEAFIDCISGIVGATASVYVGHPLDTIKTKMQTFPDRYKNLYDSAKIIVQKEGIRGLYAGTIPCLAANTAENGILFMAYGQCQSFLCFLCGKRNPEQLTAVESMAAGSLASIFSSIGLCPTELVKCRMQTLREHQHNLTQNHLRLSPIKIVHEILQKEGIRGLFRGLTSTMLRECPGYACFFGSYEFMRSLFIKENQTKADLNLFQTWISGGMAGVSFWMIMYPIDVVKTRTQVFQTDRSFFRYAYQIIETEGISALYTGLFPTLIRTFIATGTLFITYEQTRSVLRHFSN